MQARLAKQVNPLSRGGQLQVIYFQIDFCILLNYFSGLNVDCFKQS